MDFKEIIEIIVSSKYLIAFTGAGISVESGIPPFRGSGGIYKKYGTKFADIDYFFDNQDDAWALIKKVFYDSVKDVKPNVAHNFLSKLEHDKILKCLITQNIDNLHQEAGSKNVIELHGTVKTATCIKCKTVFNIDNNLLIGTPKCTQCGGIIKPGFTFFGEALPSHALDNAIKEADKSDVCIIIGASGEVMPAAQIPYIAKQNKAIIIEINPKPSLYTDDIVDYFVEDKAVNAFENIMKYF